MRIHCCLFVYPFVCIFILPNYLEVYEITFLSVYLCIPPDFFVLCVFIFIAKESR
jgi:hypothetical protein